MAQSSAEGTRVLNGCLAGSMHAAAHITSGIAATLRASEVARDCTGPQHSEPSAGRGARRVSTVPASSLGSWSAPAR